MVVRTITLVFAMLFWATSSLFPSQQESAQLSEPILKIDAKSHIASVRKVRSDHMGTYIATGSLDQTVKVWNGATGSLIATLRPPIGEGNEGKIYAVSISSDGRYVACGGFSGKRWDGKFSVYIFDVSSGAMIRRLGGLPTPVLDLSYSPDGRFLAVGLAKGAGTRIYDAQDYRVIFEDFNYGGSTYGIDFDKKGRLVTISDDGIIRIYDSKFVLLGKEKISSGIPFTVSFSPTGSLIAVGYMNAAKVDVFSGDNLKFLYSPSTKGVDNGNLSSVTWLPSGKLCAGGRWSNKNGNKLLRCWEDAGKGAFKDINTQSRDTILSLERLPNDQLVFASGEASFGIIGKDGNIKVLYPPVMADFRDKHSEFLVNDDGSEVAFSFFWSGSYYKALFSVANRYLEVNPKKFDNLKPPITKGLPVKNWQNSEKPLLGNKALSMETYEKSYCLAISPDQQGFVIGGEWSLRFFDSSGNLRWKATTPSVVRAVNITGDRRLVVAGLGDGTIRWYRLRDGVLILSMFFLPQTEQWVLWSPSGYYDASPGAEQFIGWHINRGIDREADFFPISRFRNVYYRPDLSFAILKTLDEKEALRYASKEWGRSEVYAKPEEILPPVVRIISPQKEFSTTSKEINLKFSLRAPKNAPVKSVKILLDGRPLKVEEGHWEAEEEIVRETSVSIPPKDSTISVIAFNQFAASEPAIVNVKYEEPIVEAKAGSSSKARSIERETPLKGAVETSSHLAYKPKLYVLAVGVGKYKQEDMRLLFPAKDARDFANVMTSQKGGLYRDVEVRLIVDEEATRDRIIEGLDWLRKETTSNDVAMIFMAGHGLTDNRSGRYYYMPVDGDPERLMATGIPASYIQDTVASMEGKVILFLDACYSGNILKDKKTRGIMVSTTSDVSGLVNELASAENGVIVFASSSKTQKSLEAPEWGNGAFTKALLEGLSGKADLTKQGKITINGLKIYIVEEVKKLTKGEQTPIVQIPPTSENTDRDFPIAVSKESRG